MLLATVAIWAFNVTVTRYVLTHGFLPLAYASLRYSVAAILSAGFALLLERSLAVHGRRAWALILTAALFLWANQLCFVYSLKLASATTVALILGTTPIFAALIASAVGLERLSSRASGWRPSRLFAGVALVALGSGGQLSADLGGELLAARPVRVLGRVLRLPDPADAPLLAVPDQRPRAAADDRAPAPDERGRAGRAELRRVSALDWAALAFAIVGPLVLTNVLWFTAISRVGPSRATLFANLQPFAAVLFAVVLLSEGLSALQVAGGVADRGRHPDRPRPHRRPRAAPEPGRVSR